MYIEPSTNIRILKNIPLDNSYNNTIFFDSTTNQTSYFMSKQKHNMINYTYQRVNRGVARVGIVADKLYDCNYMMFQNTNFDNKWFYAFITKVEYINNVTSEITYEIDVMQTWLFDLTLRECMVEREHSVTDNIGDNIVAENLELGEYVYANYGEIIPMRDMLVLIAIVDVDGEVNGTIYDGVYGGTRIFAYNYDDVVSINSKLHEYTSKPDSVVGIYTCPKIFIPDVEDGGKILTYKASASGTVFIDEALNGNEDFDGYTPKNKKIYTYPYNYYHIDNASGNSIALRYEFFDELKPVVKIDGCITQPVKALCRPCSYKGMSPFSELGGYTTLKNESISLECYPVCSWANDNYTRWLAQNSVPIAVNTLASIGTGNVGAMVGNLLNTFNASYRASIQADDSRGSLNSGNVNVANHTQAFYKGRKHITKEYAQIIDNFFTMFGYATNKIKVPNINARPHWSYVKTLNSNVQGSAPSDDIVKVNNIYNKGITFWVNGDSVGDYSKDNGVISEVN